MQFRMAEDALLTLGEFESVLREFGPLQGKLEVANEGLSISLTMEDFMCRRRKEYVSKMIEE